MQAEKKREGKEREVKKAVGFPTLQDKFSPSLQKATEYLSQFDRLLAVQKIINWIKQEGKVEEYKLALTPKERPFKKEKGILYVDHQIHHIQDENKKIHYVKYSTILPDGKEKEGQIELEKLGLEPEQIQPFEPKGLEVLARVQGKIAAILFGEELRKEVSGLIQFAPGNPGVLEVQHYTLLALTAKNPFNPHDFVTLCEIEPEFLIQTSSGHQFDIRYLLDAHHASPHQGLWLGNNRMHYLMNPWTGKPFNSQDIAHIIAFAKDKKVKSKTEIVQIPSKFLVCISGYEFDIRVLVQHHNARGHKTLLGETPETGKYLLNPYRNAPFNAQEAAIILECAAQKRLLVNNLHQTTIQAVQEIHKAMQEIHKAVQKSAQVVLARKIKEKDKTAPGLFGAVPVRVLASAPAAASVATPAIPAAVCAPEAFPASQGSAAARASLDEFVDLPPSRSRLRRFTPSLSIHSLLEAKAAPLPSTLSSSIPSVLVAYLGLAAGISSLESKNEPMTRAIQAGFSSAQLADLNPHQVNALVDLRNRGISEEQLDLTAQELRRNPWCSCSLHRDSLVHLMTRSADPLSPRAAIAELNGLNWKAVEAIGKGFSRAQLERLDHYQIDVLIDLRAVRVVPEAQINSATEHLRGKTWFNSIDHGYALLYLMTRRDPLLAVEAINALEGLDPEALLRIAGNGRQARINLMHSSSHDEIEEILPSSWGRLA